MDEEQNEQAAAPAPTPLTLESLEQRVIELERCKHEQQHTFSDQAILGIAQTVLRLLDANGQHFTADHVFALLDAAQKRAR